MLIQEINSHAAVGGRNIYSAIYATLLQLKPKNCLEIGTFHGYSAAVFQKYFDEFCPDGKLITCDIKSYVDLSQYKNVEQVIVRPYVDNSEQWHYVKNSELKAQTNSGIDNAAIVKSLFEEDFDFCFLDGDHQLTSVVQDFVFARELLKQPQYILFDDTEEVGQTVKTSVHDSVRYFYEEITMDTNIEYYNFKNWQSFVGAALIWNKQ